MVEAVDYSTLLDDSRAFLTELADNNTRDWFTANKARYDTDLKRPAERLLTDVARDLSKQIKILPRTKLFRPHRDIRFSEDKTPYHTHLHMLWSLPDGRGWFFGIAADYASLGAGMMGFDADQIEDWREAIDGPQGVEFERLLEEGGWRLNDVALKRVPAPYPQDHPRAALLQRKGLVVWQDDQDADLRADLFATVTATFREMQPVTDWLAEQLV